MNNHLRYERLAKKHSTIGKVIEECADYEEIGTVEEFRKLKDKNTPKKPILNKTMNIYFCPLCERRINYAHSLFCSGCGQAIDWN